MKRYPIYPIYSELRKPGHADRWSAALLAIMLLTAAPSYARTLTVTNTGDSGPGSLRGAIASAHSGDTIKFSITGTITLTSGSLMVDKNLTIKGPGAAQLAVHGGNDSPVFLIGTENNSTAAAISGLTIEGGGGGDVSPIGGGIYNEATLTLTNTTVSDSENAFGSGGGIYNSGILTLKDSTVSGNDGGVSGSGAGGGIYNLNILTMVNTTVVGNESWAGGSGIYNAGTAKITRSTVADNDSMFDSGIENTGTLTLINSTVSGNHVFDPPGGGITTSGVLTVIDSTIANNSTDFSGISGINGSGTATLKSNIFASNTSSDSSGGNCMLQGSVTSLGYNISDDDTCASFLTATADESNVTPGAGLDPNGLRNNGGPAETIALLPSSPAVNHVPVTDCTDAKGNPIRTDERGVRRPQGPACDSGAFELTIPFSSFSARLAIETSQDPSFGLTSRFTLGKSSNGIHPPTEPVTLQIANYSVDIPAGSFHRLWNGPTAPYEFDGTINGTKLVVGFIPLGGNSYQFNAVGSAAPLSGITNPVTVSLTVGDNSGSGAIKAIINKQ